MAEVTRPYQVGKYWTNLISTESGESVNFEEVEAWVDGTPMSDALCDGVVYRKLPDSVGGGYVKRVITDGLINVKWFGATAVDGNDSTSAIQAAVNVAESISIPGSAGPNIGVLIPKENYATFGYNIYDTINVPPGINFIMEGRCRYEGPQDRVAINIGVVSTPSNPSQGCSYLLNLNTPLTSNWDNEDFVGVRLINLAQCKIDVEYVMGFYKGIECLGANQGYAYNQMHIKRLNSNKFGLYLDYTGTGWCNENIFYGGRFSTNNGHNQGQGRVGIRVTGDDNRFLYPSFELGRATSTPELSQAAIFEDAYNCQILGCRNEGNANTLQSPAGYAFEMRGTSKENIVEVAFTFNRERSRESTCFLDTSDTKQNVYRSMQNMYVDAMFGRTVYDTGNLADSFSYYSDTNGGYIADMLFADRDSGALSWVTPAGRSARIVDVGRGDEVEINSFGFAVWLSTTQSKKFNIIRDGHPFRAGAVALKFYDSSGVEITDEDNPGIDAQNSDLVTNQTFSYSEYYGGCYITGTPAPIGRAVYFSVKPEVARVLVIVGSPAGFTTLSSFQILSLDNSAHGVTTQGHRLSRLSTSNIRRWGFGGLPTDGTYTSGELYFEDNPPVGESLVKLCTSPGTARNINETGSYASGTSITDVSNIGQFSIGDRITIGGSPSRLVTALDIPNNTLILDSPTGLTPGTGLTIVNNPPTFREGLFLDLTKSDFNTPEGNESANRGAIYQHVGTGTVSHPLYVKTEHGGTSGWKYVLTEDDIPETATTSTEGLVKQMSAIANIGVPDAVVEADTIPLANANKAKIDQILIAMRAAGLLDT